MTSSNVTLIDIIGALYHLPLHKNRNIVFGQFTFFLKQINFIFMESLYEAVILCHCILKYSKFISVSSS